MNLLGIVEADAELHEANRIGFTQTYDCAELKGPARANLWSIEDMFLVSINTKYKNY